MATPPLDRAQEPLVLYHMDNPGRSEPLGPGYPSSAGVPSVGMTRLPSLPFSPIPSPPLAVAASDSLAIDMAFLHEPPQLPSRLPRADPSEAGRVSGDLEMGGIGLPSRIIHRLGGSQSEGSASRRASEPSGAPPPPAGDSDSVSGVFHQFLGQNPELREVAEALEKYIPFVCLLVVKLVFDHSAGIVIFVCLQTTFFHANSVVKQQVARQDRRNNLALLAVWVNLAACIGFIYYMFQDDKLYHCLIFMPPTRVESFYDLLWLVGVNDFILKFIAVIFKVVLVFLPKAAIPYQKRGKYFLFIERSNQVHRELAPIQIWLIFLLNGYEQIPGKILGVILTAVYMVAKGKILLRVAKCWKMAVHKILQSTSYGKSPTPEEMKAAGGSCPICYENYRLPTLLHCKHIFCEECLATWFDRERTCPLCRAQVTEDPQWRDGSTSQFIQLY